MRILLVEDELAIARGIRRGLEQERFEVETAHDGAAGLEMALGGGYALLLLDWMLPKMDGLQICTELRRRRINTPVLMLTARSTVEDRVQGLEIGADDYLPKPFDFAELLARVRALIRRDRVHRSGTIRIEDLEIDTRTRLVMRGGSEIPLSQREYVLLEALASREGVILSREMIQEQVWMDDESYSNVVDVYIGMLRKKIDSNREERLIHTVRGRGYVLRRPDSGVTHDS